MIEIELKARVRDARAVGDAVAAFARRVGEIDKRDAYWRAPGWREEARRRDFRLRIESGAAVVTFKEKRVEAGIEVNDEREFGVSDPGAFAALAERIGCELWYEKRKRGARYEAPSSVAAGGTAVIELVEVDGLGRFLEIEILVDDARAGSASASIEAARTELRALLSRSGLSESDIESRFYSELLAESGAIPGR